MSVPYTGQCDEHMRSILVAVHAATEPDQGQFACHQHGNLSPRFHRRALTDSVSNWKDNCRSSEPTFPYFDHWGPAKLKACGESLQPKATAVADLPTRSLPLFHLFVLLPLPPSTPLGLCVGPQGKDSHIGIWLVSCARLAEALRRNLQLLFADIDFAVKIGEGGWHVACTLHAGLGGVADGTNHKTSK